MVVRQVDLEIYTRPSATRGPVYIKSVRTVEIWEVVALDPLPLASMSPLWLLVISRSGVELITLESDTVLNDVIKCNSSLLAEMPYRKDFPWYHLAANGTGRRVCWFGIQDWLRMQPHLVSMALDPRPSPSDSRSALTTWMDEELTNSALWALPSLDFDEALGYTVLGNCFGELAIYDYVPSDPIKCCGLASDLTHHQRVSSPVRLSQVCFRIQNISSSTHVFFHAETYLSRVAALTTPTSKNGPRYLVNMGVRLVGRGFKSRSPFVEH